MIRPLDQYPFLTPYEIETLRAWRKTEAAQSILRILGNVARVNTTRDTLTMNANYELGKRDAYDDMVLSIALIGTPPPPQPTPLQTAYGRPRT